MVGRDFHPACARTHRSLPRRSHAYIQTCVSVYARVYDQHGGSYVHGTVHGGRSRIYRVEWSTPGSVDQWLTAPTDTAAAGSRDDPGSGAWSMTWTMTSVANQRSPTFFCSLLWSSPRALRSRNSTVRPPRWRFIVDDYAKPVYGRLRYDLRDDASSIRECGWG